MPLPPKLFSHNDQQSVWQAYRPIGEGAKIGWGGRIGDLLASQNANALFTCISAGGNSVFLSGTNVLQYQVGSSGPSSISSISGTIYGSGGTAASTAYRSLITGTSPNLFENELRVVTNRSITANQQLCRGASGGVHAAAGDPRQQQPRLAAQRRRPHHRRSGHSRDEPAGVSW